MMGQASGIRAGDDAGGWGMGSGAEFKETEQKRRSEIWVTEVDVDVY